MAANGHATTPGAGWAAPKYEVQVKSERFKFNAAHFVAFPGYRERLHGHNYTCSVRVFGPLSERDGYVLDFGDVKKATRRVCEQLNERFLCACLANFVWSPLSLWSRAVGVGHFCTAVARPSPLFPA